MHRGLALALVAIIVGCSGGDGDDEATPLLAKEHLARVVLQPSDVGRRYVRFDQGRQLFADNPEGVDPTRFGRVDGWKARYRLPATAGTRGPLVIESRADLFESVDGADEELERLREEVDKLGDPVESPPTFGDESVAAGPSEVVSGGLAIYAVAWRHANVTARLTIQGIQGHVTPAQVFALARKQQLRILRAPRA